MTLLTIIKLAAAAALGLKIGKVRIAKHLKVRSRKGDEMISASNACGLLLPEKDSRNRCVVPVAFGPHECIQGDTIADQENKQQCDKHDNVTL